AAAPFFGEREAVKLAFDDTGTTIAEQTPAHQSFGTAQPLNLVPLAVPNTLLAGIQVGIQFQVQALDVTGSIAIDPDTHKSEDDYFSFQGRAGELINLQVLSGSLRRSANPIDSVLQVWYADPTTQAPALAPYYQSVAQNDDTFESPD